MCNCLNLEYFAAIFRYFYVAVC